MYNLLLFYLYILIAVYKYPLVQRSAMRCHSYSSIFSIPIPYTFPKLRYTYILCSWKMLRDVSLCAHNVFHYFGLNNKVMRFIDQHYLLYSLSFLYYVWIYWQIICSCYTFGWIVLLFNGMYNWFWYNHINTVNILRIQACIYVYSTYIYVHSNMLYARI